MSRKRTADLAGPVPLESENQRDILIEATRAGQRLMRNNVGAFEDKTGRWVHYGVGGTGGSDLLGLTPVKITPEMVGRTVAVFTAIEVKRQGKKPTPEQAAFLAMVQSLGGIAGVARSAQDYQGIHDEFIAGCSSARGADSEPHR